MSELLKNVAVPPGNRRSFVRNLALASAAAGIVASPNKANAQTTDTTDVDILNFALNLEYLEAEFYTMATAGTTIDNFGITITGSGTAGATTGGGMIPFSTTDNTVQRVAEELARDERFHVSLLQNTIIALGGTPVAKPAINLNALGLGFGSPNDFLTLARVFEEIGVTAYGGAAPLITSSTVLGYAARILATEAEHVGFIRALINQYGVTVTALDMVDVVPPPAGGDYFSVNSNAITAIRTPGQVLYLAYDAKDASKGGFFPAGVNGALAASTGPVVPDAAIFTLTPNPSLSSGGYATVTVSWAAPANVEYIEVRIGSPSGPLFTLNTAAGSMTTGPWVTDGMLFYLQDVTPPKNQNQYLTAANTLAVAIARVNTPM